MFKVSGDTPLAAADVDLDNDLIGVIHPITGTNQERSMTLRALGEALGGTFSAAAAAPVDAVAASGTITDGNANNFDVNQTITIGDVVYTFKDVLSAGPAVQGEVLIGASADASLNNLVNCINHDPILGVPGVDYTMAAAHPLVSAAPVGANATVITARIKGVSGNAIALAKVGAWGSVSGAHLAGGVDGTPGVAGTMVIVGGQPYLATTDADVTTVGAWKKLTVGNL